MYGISNSDLVSQTWARVCGVSIGLLVEKTDGIDDLDRNAGVSNRSAHGED